MDAKTSDILVEWYKMAEKHLGLYYPDQTITIDFRKLISSDQATRKMICARLDIEYNNFIRLHEIRIMHADHKSSNAYVNLDEDQLALVLKEVPFMIPYCKK